MTAIGGRAWISSLCDSCVMYLPGQRHDIYVTAMHSLLQDLAFCRLRIPKVHHFIEQFIDNDKIVPDTLLFQDLEVFGENLDDLVEE